MNRHLPLWLTLLLLTLPPSLSAALEGLLSVVDRQIIPAYQQLQHQSAALQQQGEQCQPEQPPTALKQHFQTTMAAWQQIQYLRLGPAEFNLRHYRIHFWPDKRGSGSRQLLQFLAAADLEPLQPAQFAHQSAALQGLTALEQLLFANAPPDSYRCQLIAAITTELHHNATALYQGWTQPLENAPPFRHYIATASEGNAFFESRSEVESQLLNQLHTQLQFMIDHKLTKPLGTEPAKANGRLAESWRSQRSLDNLAQNLLSLRQVIELLLLPQLEGRPLKTALQQQLHQAQTTLNSIDIPLTRAVSDPEQRPRLEVLRQQLQQLQQLIATEVTAQLGISLGFNSLDGD
ncbi:hypothetical protein D5085_09565 [Ectothiorhodospiraceae bacterium BW-2]|nr:hypothetical protein D5085_09565 [Ectothiorhodospiraceae bacterium BW-2]